MSRNENGENAKDQASEQVVRGTQLVQKLSSDLGLLALETQRLWNQLKSRAPALTPVDDAPILELTEDAADRFWTEAEAIRESGQSFGVFLVRVDLLEQLQHDHGSQIADEIFSKLEERLKLVGGSPARMGRWSPSEFAVAVRGSQAELVAYAEQIRRQAGRLFGKGVTENVYWRCTASVGASIDPGTSSDDRPSLARLVRGAERALKEAQERGCNQVRVAA